MDPVIFFAVLGTFYGVVMFFDFFFKSCMHYPYEAFLHNTGITVKFLRIKWHTTALNRTIFRWGSSCSKILVQSFNIGVIITIIMLPIGIFILLLTLFGSSNNENNSQFGNNAARTIAIKNSKMITDSRIEILLPGVNLPLEEIGFYILTLIVCSIVHELGHALAAVLEDIPVSGFGLQIYFCIPLAYTEINTEHMNGLKAIRKMRILCGGIWHNLVLSGFCYLLFLSLGTFLNPFYTIDESVIITNIDKRSPLLGERGLFKNDIITKINNCPVYNDDTWFTCLLETIKNKPEYCVSSDFIRLNDESGQISHHNYDGIIQCCSDKTNIKTSCFEYINNDDDLSNDNPIEIPQYVCLDIRKTIEDSYAFCRKKINLNRNDNSKNNGYNNADSNKCDKGYFCIKPLFNNVTTIITLYRKNKNNIVIYIGHPSDISRTIKISPFVPKMNLLKPQLADNLLLFIKYNIVFSLGLALINTIPCFGFDGYHITNTIINNYLVTKIITERGKRDLLVLLVTSLCTLLFLCSIVKIFWISIFNRLF